jgi:hypothetical protein
MESWLKHLLEAQDLRSALALVMVVLGRISHLRGAILAGRQCTMHCSANPSTKCEKIKFLLQETAEANHSPQVAVLAVLDVLVSACVSDAVHIMDRGHKHTSGVSEVCFYIKQVDTARTKPREATSFPLENFDELLVEEIPAPEWQQAQLSSITGCKVHSNATGEHVVSSPSSMQNTNADADQANASAAQTVATSVAAAAPAAVTFQQQVQCIATVSNCSSGNDDSSDNDDVDIMFNGVNVLTVITTLDPAVTPVEALLPRISQFLDQGRARWEIKSICRALEVAYPDHNCFDFAAACIHYLDIEEQGGGQSSGEDQSEA